MCQREADQVSAAGEVGKNLVDELAREARELESSWH